MDKDASNVESRRKFLKTAGKFAVYTPPALMVMSKANANKIAYSNGNGASQDGGSLNSRNRSIK